MQTTENPFGGILVTDVSGKIIYANKTIISTKGFTFDEIKFKTPGDLWGGNMDEHFYKELWTTIKDKKKAFFGEVENRTSDGQNKLEGIHIAPIMNHEGEIEFFLEIQPAVYDSSSSKQLHHELQQVIENQQRHPENLRDLIGRWIGSSDLSDTKVQTSQDLIEKLLISQSDLNFNEDLNLIELSKSNKIYFNKLFEKYQAKIFNYFLYRLGKNITLAEDMSQETFVRALGALDHFEYRNVHYLSYLLMIAHNLLVNYYRMFKPILIDDLNLIPVHTDPTAQKDTEIELIWGAVHKLSRIDQTILTMKYSNGLSIKEISKNLHKSENAIKLHLSRSRKKLRDYFKTNQSSPI